MSLRWLQEINMAKSTPQPKTQRRRKFVLSESEKKKRNVERCRRYRQLRVDIGTEAERWRQLKTVVGEDNDAAFAQILLDMLEESLGLRRGACGDTSQRLATPSPEEQTYIRLKHKMESIHETVHGCSDEEEARQLVMVHSTLGREPSLSNAETPVELLNGQLAGTSPDKREPIIIQPKESDRLFLNVELSLDEIRVKEEAQTIEVNGELVLSKEKVDEEEDREEEEELEEDKDDDNEGEEEKCDDPSWLPGSSWKTKRNQADVAVTGDPNNSMKRTRSRRTGTLKKQKKNPTCKIGQKEKKKQNKCKDQHLPKEESTEEMVESNVPLPQELKRNIEMEIFPCNFCEETFDTYQPMVAHSLSCHGDQEVKMCSFCGYQWKELIEDRVQEVTKHLAEAHDLEKLVNPGGNKGDKYVCAECTFMCTIPSLFVFHVEDQHEKTMFSCVKCPYKVIHRYQIHLHLERQHEWDRSSPVCEHIKVIKRDLASHKTYKEGYYPCGICGQRFLRGNIRKHVQTVHRAEVEGQDFKCQDCSRQFTTYRAFRQHRSQAHKNVKCAICQKYFGNRRILHDHIEMTHVGVKHFHCSICDFYAYNRGRFSEHMSSVHQGLRSYLCELCGKKFKTSHALEVHTRIHTGEKPLTCEFCEYSCRQRNALNWHMKKHKDKVAVKI